MNKKLISFLPQAVVESRYDTENPIHRIYLYLFYEDGRISEVRYKEKIEINIIVQFPGLSGNNVDLDMWIKIPR